MATSRKLKGAYTGPGEIAGKERTFSYLTTTFILLVLSSLVFLSAAFIYLHLHFRSGNVGSMAIPKSFPPALVTSMLCSFFAFRLKGYFHADDSKALRLSLAAILVLSLATCLLVVSGLRHFLIGQAPAAVNWNSGLAFSLLCLVFLFHLVMGISYTIRFLSNAWTGTGDLVRSLLFFTDDIQSTRIRILTIFWHFTNFSWVLIYFLLLFTN